MRRWKIHGDINVLFSQCPTATILTLGTHAAQRGLQYLVCVCVCLSVCLSVISNLASRAIYTSNKKY